MSQENLRKEMEVPLPRPPTCYSPALIMNNVFLGVLLQKFQMLQTRRTCIVFCNLKKINI